MRVNQGLSINSTATELWLSNLQAGRCFGGKQRLVADVANFNAIQLFNPIGSGKTALVRSFIAGSTINFTLDIAMHNTALATDVGAGVNLLDGGAAGACHVRSSSPAAQVGTIFQEVNVLALDAFTPPVEWFAQLGEGQGLVLETFAINTLLLVSFLWME